MMAVMEQSPDASHDLVQDFLTSGRTGRRNAMPDILGEHAATSTADLPSCIQKLSTTDAASSGEASTSSATAPGSSSATSSTTATEPTDSEMQEVNAATTSS